MTSFIHAPPRTSLTVLFVLLHAIPGLLLFLVLPGLGAVVAFRSKVAPSLMAVLGVLLCGVVALGLFGFARGWAVGMRLAVVPRLDRCIPEDLGTYLHGTEIYACWRDLAAGPGGTPGLGTWGPHWRQAWHPCGPAAVYTRELIGRLHAEGASGALIDDLERIERTLLLGEAHGARFRWEVVSVTAMNSELRERARAEGY